jgi:MSHA pilin protein MshA
MIVRTQRGFTLIELVVVITILGILAAFAVPRFISLESQARTASVQALAGSLRSSAALARSMAMAQGNPATVSMEGKSITLVNNYPAGTDAGTGGIVDTLADYTGFTTSAASGVVTFSKSGASSNCNVTYTAAASGAAPAITPTTTGC